MIIFLLISGPGQVIELYYALDGPCYYVLYRLDFGLSSPYKGDSIRFLLKLWIMVNGT